VLELTPKLVGPSKTLVAGIVGENVDSYFGAPG
jgi:hypothetical protein